MQLLNHVANAMQRAEGFVLKRALVSQELRTLELCVNNLQPDFLYDHKYIYRCVHVII